HGRTLYGLDERLAKDVHRFWPKSFCEGSLGPFRRVLPVPLRVAAGEKAVEERRDPHYFPRRARTPGFRGRAIPPMLSQLRHIQKGLLIAVTAVIVVSFAFLYSDYDFVGGTFGRQDCEVKVYDRCYRSKEAQKLASHFDVAYQLGMYDFAMVLLG